MPQIPEIHAPERHEGEPLEVVRAASLIEMPDVLRAGAAFAMYKTIGEEPDESSMWPKATKEVKTIYLAASPKNISRVLASGHFDKNWEVDSTAYAPYVCITNKNIGSLSPVFAALAQAVPETLKFVADDGMYVWEKDQERREREEQQEHPKAA